ncbi:Tryptophan--tRNA ligase, mitochondrial [Friedmanniomyces endolithicus]|uniref:Tryptophan--tRNA ligase, mitochondrial n=1 Tax=Rachicladosporium monterosium TaxID=1507873 RepID=A0ABR0L146_9PEZI|nr:Tryptophan--tRNA ligase, mitochondrial [Friedmanniomyces endolithicus]KAK5141887.1 Tryptophan--tRNA ligase, mitochondrial [Rachicladosporium monterosium]
MSKSHPNPNSRLLLTDSEETIRRKIKAAVTDSTDGITYDPEGRPGDELAKDLADQSMRALKDRVAETVESTIKHIRGSYAHFLDDNDHLDSVAAQGAEKAAKSAAITMKAVKSAVGLS